MVVRKPLGFPYGRRVMHLFTVAVLVIGAGCAPKAAPPPAALQLADDFRLPTQVAVLPFANSTPEPTAPDMVRKVFYNFFSSLNYRDVELFTVDQMLKDKNRDALAATGNGLPLGQVCQYLGVDAIVGGQVTRFKKLYAALYTNTQVGGKIWMRHCETGQLIWQMEHTANQRDGDLPLDIPGLAMSLVTTYMRYARVSMLEVTIKLCTELIATIPNPVLVGESPPKISIMVHNGADRPIRPGDALRVALVGEPGHTASWDLSEDIRNLPLVEKEHGIYVGEYVVQKSDKHVSAHLVGWLTASSGAKSRWVDVLGPVTLGEPTPVPALIEQDLTLTRNNGPYLASDWVVVSPNATLTVEPGVSVWFQEFGMVVKGRLHAEGEPGRPVRFLGLGDNPWKGVILDAAQGENRLIHSELAGAQHGVHARGSKLVVDNTVFRDNQWGIVMEGGELVMIQSILRDSRKAGLSARRSRVAVDTSLITDNAGGGAQFLQSRVELTGNSIFGNQEWDVKNHDPQATLQLPGNWWGTTDPAAVRIKGSVEVTPLLETAPALLRVER